MPKVSRSSTLADSCDASLEEYSDFEVVGEMLGNPDVTIRGNLRSFMLKEICYSWLKEYPPPGSPTALDLVQYKEFRYRFDQLWTLADTYEA